MEKRLAFGLLGCGRIGRRHAEHMHTYGSLVAVCDTDQDKADELADIYQAIPYYNLEDFLNMPQRADLIAVCTPNGMHAQHSIDALAAGFHVLCEKPLALSVLDCRAMIKSAETHNRQLFVVKQNRFNPPVQAVKKLLKEKKLGKIFSIQLNCFWNRDAAYYDDAWHGTKDLDGGILFTQFSHFIDLLYWFFGDIAELQALGSNFAHQFSTEFDDTVVVICRFQSGALGTMHFTTNARNKNMEGSLTIFGEKGTVKIGGAYLNKLEYSAPGELFPGILAAGNPSNNYGDYTGSMSNHHIVYQNILDVLTGKGSPVAHILDGLKTVELIESIYRTCAENEKPAVAR